jgi:hypothetical protein
MQCGQKGSFELGERVAGGKGRGSSTMVTALKNPDALSDNLSSYSSDGLGNLEQRFFTLHSLLQRATDYVDAVLVCVYFSLSLFFFFFFLFIK